MRPPDKAQVREVFSLIPGELTTRQIALFLFPQATETEMSTACVHWTRKRLDQLHKDGVIESVGFTISPCSHNRMTVWRLAE